MIVRNGQISFAAILVKNRRDTKLNQGSAFSLQSHGEKLS
jgi:hypothetical protein